MRVRNPSREDLFREHVVLEDHDPSRLQWPSCGRLADDAADRPGRLTRRRLALSKAGDD
jgi:hypothetical protein